jgi:hypothetical protein
MEMSLSCRLIWQGRLIRPCFSDYEARRWLAISLYCLGTDSLSRMVVLQNFVTICSWFPLSLLTIIPTVLIIHLLSAFVFLFYTIFYENSSPFRIFVCEIVSTCSVQPEQTGSNAPLLPHRPYWFTAEILEAHSVYSKLLKCKFF